MKSNEIVTFQRGNHQCFYLTEDGIVLSNACIDLNRFVLSDVETVKGRRRQGLATSVVEYAVKWFKERYPKETLRLISTDDALNIYKGLGFKLIKTFEIEYYEYGGRHEMLLA